MGCSFAGKKSSAGVYKAPNPIPTNFKVKRIWQDGKYLLVMINYPDCTTYKGNKILVYRTTEKLFLKRKSIDPHFLGKDGDPIARFPGNEYGWDLGVDLIIKLNS